MVEAITFTASCSRVITERDGQVVATFEGPICTIVVYSRSLPAQAIQWGGVYTIAMTPAVPAESPPPEESPLIQIGEVEP